MHDYENERNNENEKVSSICIFFEKKKNDVWTRNRKLHLWHFNYSCLGERGQSFSGLKSFSCLSWNRSRLGHPAAGWVHSRESR